MGAVLANGGDPEVVRLQLQDGSEIVVRYFTGTALGHTPWPGSVFLAEYLDKHAQELDLINKSVLELGSGACTVAGLAASHLCKEAVLTDRADIIEALAVHVQATEADGLECRWKAKVLEWQDLEFTSACFPPGCADIVLMSDVVYFPHLFEPLLLTLLSLCTRETDVFWANCDVFPRLTPDLSTFMADAQRFFDVSLEAEVAQESCKTANFVSGGKCSIWRLKISDEAQERQQDALEKAMRKSCVQRCFF